jgi:metallo-beta-lactamase family protein
LVIPAFSVERTQELLYDIFVLLQEKKIRSTTKVFIDSPLAIKATKIFTKFVKYYDSGAKKLFEKSKNIFENSNFHFTLSGEKSKKINNEKGCIILSASGMCDAGRIKHHLRHNLPSVANTILLVGYQAAGTLGICYFQEKWSDSWSGGDCEHRLKNFSPKDMDQEDTDWISR